MIIKPLKDKIKLWVEQLPQDFNQFAQRLLTKRLNTYMNVILAQDKNKTRAKADIFRHLVRHVQEIIKKLDNLEKELVKAKAEIYFPLDKEKLYIVNKRVTIKDMETNKDWTRAYKQDEERGKK